MIGKLQNLNSCTYISAPEIFNNQGGYGHACDWWSLGVIMYLMYTRKVSPVY